MSSSKSRRRSKTSALALQEDSVHSFPLAKEAAIGTSGAVVGAIVAGPLGAIVGGVLGTAFGAAASTSSSKKKAPAPAQQQLPRSRKLTAKPATSKGQSRRLSRTSRRNRPHSS